MIQLENCQDKIAPEYIHIHALRGCFELKDIYLAIEKIRNLTSPIIRNAVWNFFVEKYEIDNSDL